MNRRALLASLAASSVLGTRFALALPAAGVRRIDVVLDVDSCEGVKKESAAVFTALAKLGHVEGRNLVVQQVLSEYYVNATRKLDPGLSPDEAWDDVEMLLTWNPLPIDRSLLQAGREIERRHRVSWWDSLIVAAARLQGCSLLLSEDLQDGAVIAGVTVRSPFTLASAEASAVYRTGPGVVARHPRRGRPRVRA